MKNLFGLLLLFVSTTLLGQEKNHKIIYHVSPLVKDNVPMLKIKMSFMSNITGYTELIYADNPWGQEDMQGCIVEMKLNDTKSDITRNKEKGLIQIAHTKESKTLDFEYIIKQDFEGGVKTQNYFRPIINSTYFHVISQSFFMIPSYMNSNADDRLDIEIYWDDFPENYVIHNSFGSRQRHQVIEDVSISNFQNTVFVGGDYRIHISEVNDNKVALAIRGDWINFKDSVVTDLLNKTVKLQRDFWKDHSQEYFTVILLPIENEVNSYSYSGTGLFNSFTTVFSNNGYEDVYDLTYLFNHELMHNWINVENITKNEEQQYWFSEGFTDYYTHKNIAKNKVLGLDEEYWLDKINKTIKDLYTSPVAESPNSEMNTENYWTNRDYEQLPYRRGGLLAFIIDHKIRKESNGNYSLDHVMREIFTRVKEDKSIINEEFFVEIANKYTKTSLASFIEKHVIQGKLPDLQEIFTTYDFKFNAISEVFDLGFQPNEEYNKIISIDTTSRAYKAGLRATDRLGRWGFSYGVMDKEIKMNVVRDEQKLVIKYFPVKEMGIPTLQNNEHNITILKSMN